MVTLRTGADSSSARSRRSPASAASNPASPVVGSRADKTRSTAAAPGSLRMNMNAANDDRSAARPQPSVSARTISSRNASPGGTFAADCAHWTKIALASSVSPIASPRDHRCQGFVGAPVGQQGAAKVAIDIDKLRLDRNRALIVLGGGSETALRCKDDAEIADRLGIVRLERHDLPELLAPLHRGGRAEAASWPVRDAHPPAADRSRAPDA